MLIWNAAGMEPSSCRKYPSTSILTGKDLHRSDHPEESPLPLPVPCTSRAPRETIQITLHTRLFITALDGVGPQAAIDADGIHGFSGPRQRFQWYDHTLQMLLHSRGPAPVVVGAPPPATPPCRRARAQIHRGLCSNGYCCLIPQPRHCV